MQVQQNWWNKDVSKDEVHNKVFSTLENIQENQYFREENNLKFAALYANQEILGMYGQQFFSQNSLLPGNRIILNVIKACIDTAAAKISKVKPNVMFLTTKGDYSQKRKSKQLNQYLAGVFDDIELHDLARKCFVHAATMGTGFIKFYPDYTNKKIGAEHVLTSEIIVDDNEAIYGKPRTIYQRKYIDKEVLCAKFPKFKDEISQLNVDWAINTPNVANHQVLVVESWRLPSYKGAKDGKHTICVQNATLFYESYDKDYFPFVEYRFYKPLAGFWGKGIAEEIMGVQLEINKILRNIQRAQRLMSVPRIFVKENSNFNPEVLSNEFATWYKYSGEKPTAEVFQAMSGEVYQHLWNLYEKAFQIIGISELSATGQKPAGLDAAVALRTYQDIQTERFALPSLAYEKIFVDAAHIIVDMSKDLFENLEDLNVKVNLGKFVKSIKWQDVCLPDDAYIIRSFPVSSLPQDPWGRLQFIQELIQGGYIDKEFGQSLLDFPDLDSYMNLATASIDSISYIMECILEEDRYVPPTPYIDLTRAQQVAHWELLRGEADGLPEVNAELLRIFIEECQVLLDKANPPQPLSQVNLPLPGGLPPQPGTESQAVPINEINPQAVPEAPPVSDLVPNIPNG